MLDSGMQKLPWHVRRACNASLHRRLRNPAWPSSPAGSLAGNGAASPAMTG